MDAAPVDHTFLFTDIDGAVAMWEQGHDRAARTLALHNRLVRSAIEAHHGRVIKTTDNGIYAVFINALDAVQAVAVFQSALGNPETTNGAPIRVRCGLHAGPAVERDGDFFGSTINRAARIMAVGHGGQTLLSAAVANRVRDGLPPELTLRDLGATRLKDLAAPELIFQLTQPDLPHEFPPLRSLEALPNNLPQQLTSFIGREHELSAAKELLAHTRLLTLLGMGGLGKTRLSLQIGADLLDSYQDGAWFLDLAPIADPSLVLGEMAQVLGVREEPGKLLLQSLCSYLSSRRLLIIVDNCEHLLESCGNLINAVLCAAPNVHIIATSREALRVTGEQIYSVYPLSVPEPATTLAALSMSPAVQLFIDRAQLQRPGFVLTEKDAPAIAELCARLEGIPLALELAAARMRALSPQDINKRLQNRFTLLTGGGRVLLERQQTLRALVAWSYDLLTEHEQLFFDRLAIFAGGFDAAAAAAVCGADPLLAEEVVVLTTSLAEKSLIMPRDTLGERRFGMLETLREYAREGLLRRTEFRASSARHCDHYFALAKIARDMIKGPEQADGMLRLERDLDNLRAAIVRCQSGDAEPVLGVKIQVAMMRFWILRGYATEGRNYIRATLALPPVQAIPLVHAHALYLGGTLAASQSDYGEAHALLLPCLALRRDIGDTREIAATLSTLALIHLNEGQVIEARASEEEALDIFRTLGDQIGEAIGQLHLGEICMDLADLAKAQQCLDECLQLARTLKHLEIEGECERSLGELALENGEPDKAQLHLNRSLAIVSAAADRRGEAMAWWWLGKIALHCDNLVLASHQLDRAMRAFAEFEMSAELLDCLDDHANLQQRLRNPVLAARIYAAAALARQRLALRRRARVESRWQRANEELQASLSAEALAAAQAEGEACTLAKIVQQTSMAASAAK